MEYEIEKKYMLYVTFTFATRFFPSNRKTFGSSELELHPISFKHFFGLKKDRVLFG